MTSRDSCYGLNGHITELKMIPLLQRRLDDDTIVIYGSRYNCASRRQRPRQNRTENSLYA
jgi:hypothetical protein